MTDLNPQREQMSDESMVRNLEAQARAIWPQEIELVRRYGLPDDIRILDAGCGTGEGASRFAELFPHSQVLGVDILDHHLELARKRYERLAPRLSFDHQSIYELPSADNVYDLVTCRHVLHSIPFPERVLSELKRVTCHGGMLHLIPEDYGMLHFERIAPIPDEMWGEAPVRFGESTNTDLFIGRHIHRHLVNLGLQEIRQDYVIVDPMRVPREIFAAILQAWRDGYVEPVAAVTRFSQDQVRAYFDQMIANIEDPKGYAVWMVPVVSARVL